MAIKTSGKKNVPKVSKASISHKIAKSHYVKNTMLTSNRDNYAKVDCKKNNIQNTSQQIRTVTQSLKINQDIKANISSKIKTIQDVSKHNIQLDKSSKPKMNYVDNIKTDKRANYAENNIDTKVKCKPQLKGQPQQIRIAKLNYIKKKDNVKNESKNISISRVTASKNSELISINRSNNHIDSFKNTSSRAERSPSIIVKGTKSIASQKIRTAKANNENRVQNKKKQIKTTFSNLKVGKGLKTNKTIKSKVIYSIIKTSKDFNGINVTKRIYTDNRKKVTKSSIGNISNSRIKDKVGLKITSQQIKTIKINYIKNTGIVNKNSNFNVNFTENNTKNLQGRKTVKVKPKYVKNNIQDTIKVNYNYDRIKTRKIVLNKSPVKFSFKNSFKGKNKSFFSGTLNTTFEKLKNDRNNNTDTATDSIYFVKNKSVTAKKAVMATIKFSKKTYKFSKNIYINFSKTKSLKISKSSRNILKIKLNINKNHDVTKSVKEKVWNSLNNGNGTEDTSVKAIYDTREYLKKGKEITKGTKELIRFGKSAFTVGKKIYTKSRKTKLGEQLFKKQVRKKISTKNLINKIGNKGKIRTTKVSKSFFMKKHKYKIKQRKSKIAYKALKEVASTITKKIVNIVATNPYILGGIAVFLIIFIVVSNTNTSVVSGSLPANFILASEETVKEYKDEIERLDAEFKDKIEDYRTNPRYTEVYDDIRIDYMNEEGIIATNWHEILAILSVKYEQDLKFRREEQDDVIDLFNKFNEIKTRSEKYFCSSEGCEGHVRLIVEVYTYGLEEILPDLTFEEWQEDWTRRLAANDLSQMFPGLDIPPLDGSLSGEDLWNELQNLPQGAASREKIVKTGLSLVGKVSYFWGGKSPAGWNSKWGKPALVTAPGSSNTGKHIPYGLDCSGFVDWVYKTSGVGNLLSGGGTSYQWNKSYAINESDLKPGDLVFKNTPGTSGVNHVGIYVGRDSNGKKLFVHCASSQGVVVNSYKGFKYWRRPLVKLD